MDLDLLQKENAWPGQFKEQGGGLVVEQARGRLPGSNATCDKNIHVRGSNRKQFVMNKNIKESLVAVRVGVETNKDVLLTGRVNQSKTV